MRFISRFKFLCAIMSIALVSSFAVHAAEPPTEPILRIDPSEHTAPIYRIATDDAGRWLVTASDDKTARVWNVRDGRLVTTLRVPAGSGNEGKLKAVAISPDGQTVALGGWTQFNNGSSQLSSDGMTIYLFDRASGRMLHRLTGLSGEILHLAVSPDGRILAATLSGHNGLRLFSVADGRLLGEDRDYGSDSYSVHFSSDGRLVTASFDGLLRLYRFDGANLTLLAKRSTSGGKQPYTARFSPNGKRVAVGFADTPAVNVLDGSDLSLSFAPNTTGVNAGLGNVAWSRDGTILYASGQAHKNFGNKSQDYIRRWSGGGAGVAQDWPVGENSVMALVTLPNGRLAFGSGESWGIVDANGMRQVFHAPSVADFRGNLSGFALSQNGTKVRFGYEVLGKSPAVFDSLNRSFLAINTLGLFPPQLRVPGLEVTDWKNTTSPKLNRSPLKLEPYETSRSLALLPGGNGFVLGTDWNLRLFNRNGTQRWQQSPPGSVWAVNVSKDGHWVVAAYADGTIRWHRATDGAERLAFYPHPDKKHWVMWTPSGYYDSSPGAEELIGWHLNRGKDQAADFFPASRFRERFYRPDVLAKVLETRDEDEAVRLANQESGRHVQTTSIIQVLPPVIEILSPQSGLEVSSTTLIVTAAIRAPADAPVTNVRARVNGLLQPDTRALKLSKSSETRDITIILPQQDAEIQVFAENKNGVSTPATLRVTWAGNKAVPSGAEEDNRFKPKLYVFAVGVSKYKNRDFNLDLASKDATDFANVFKKQKGKLYSDVVVKLLTDDNANRDEVVDGLDWLKSQVTAHDVGIMFIAGHSMNDNNGKYFFMPYNADPDKPLRTGVAQNDIKDTLNSLAGKAMFFVDTCHAGNALGTSKTRSTVGSTDAFVNELASAENGVIVFASSTGKQLSQEDLSWGNGAFTKALVEGLNGKADFQNNGKITHKGLDYYVTERVKELTNGQQSPVSISPSGITDFPIAVLVRE